MISCSELNVILVQLVRTAQICRMSSGHCADANRPQSFLAMSSLVSTILAAIAIIAFHKLGLNSIPAGPYGIIFSLCVGSFAFMTVALVSRDADAIRLWQHYRTVPPMYIFRVLGFEFSNKILIWLLALQVILITLNTFFADRYFLHSCSSPAPRLRRSLPSAASSPATSIEPTTSSSSPPYPGVGYSVRSKHTGSLSPSTSSSLASSSHWSATAPHPAESTESSPVKSASPARGEPPSRAPRSPVSGVSSRDVWGREPRGGVRRRWGVRDRPSLVGHGRRWGSG